MAATYAEGETWKNRKTGSKVKLEKGVRRATALVWYTDLATGNTGRMMRKATLIRDYDLIVADLRPVALSTGDLIVVGGKIRQVLNSYPHSDFVTLAYLGGGPLVGSKEPRPMDDATPTPTTTTFDLAETRQKFLAWVRDLYLRNGTLDPMAQIWHADNTLGCIAFDDSMDNRTQRAAIQGLVRKTIAVGSRPVAIFHAMEVWHLDQPASESPVADISKHPDRKESLVVYEETEGTKIGRWDAQISRVAGQFPELGAWVDISANLRMPRPGFKRYFPEQRTTADPGVA